jgi:hypothetical protein
MKEHKLFFLSFSIIVCTLMCLSELALAQCIDTDGDGVYIEGGVCGQVDNCPDLANPNQIDMNGDGIGNACQPCRIVAGSLSLVTNETTRTMLAAEQFFHEFDGCGCAQNGTWNATCFEGIWYGCDGGVCMPAWGPYSIEICLDGTYDVELVGTGTWDVVCDDEFDGVENNSDNCQEVANFGQEDVDNDDVGDACDNGTISGFVSGDIQGDVIVGLYRPTCGVATLIRTKKTSSTGYYAFGYLNTGFYMIVPHHFSYSFAPETITTIILQTEIHSYDFTATTISSP